MVEGTRGMDCWGMVIATAAVGAPVGMYGKEADLRGAVVLSFFEGGSSSIVAGGECLSIV